MYSHTDTKKEEKGNRMYLHQKLVKLTPSSGTPWIKQVPAMSSKVLAQGRACSSDRASYSGHWILRPPHLTSSSQLWAPPAAVSRELLRLVRPAREGSRLPAAVQAASRFRELVQALAAVPDPAIAAAVALGIWISSVGVSFGHGAGRGVALVNVCDWAAELGIVKSLTQGNGDLSAIFSFNEDGLNALHFAARAGNLDVCKYMVEELGGDGNAPGFGALAEGATPFMMSTHSGDVPTFIYFLDHGGDLMKTDDKGRTVLHHAVAKGSCKVTEFILSKGVPVDLDCGLGTPLFMAATNEQDKTVKLLLDHHANPNIIISGVGVPLVSAMIYRSLKCVKLLIKAGADVNCKGSMMTPLVFATMQGGYTNYIKLLLKAGADPNIPDDLGTLPIELAAVRDCREEVEMLLPVTTPIPNAPDWSIEGVISYAKIEVKKPIEQRHLERRTAYFKSQGDKAFRQKAYELASEFYDSAITHGGESAVLYANMSLCKLHMGDGDGALSDALRNRMLRPKWAKACFRQAAAHMLLKEYKQACDALEDAQKLDPGNAEIETELRKARELMKNPPGDGKQ